MNKNKLKCCPFCGDIIRVVEQKENIVLRIVRATCLGCGMTFTHEQDFAYAITARIPLNDSFEYTWNRRDGESND